MSKRPAKSETLTIRLDPKTRFMLEFVARLRGQTITTVVERAISDAANRATIERYQEEPISWRDFWSINDGERALKIAGEPALHPTYEEERRLEFTKQFWPFFYYDRQGEITKDQFLEVLWPHIDYLLQAHDEMKSSNINAGPQLMTSLLEEAQIDPPQWPPPPRQRVLDDTIPF